MPSETAPTSSAAAILRVTVVAPILFLELKRAGTKTAPWAINHVPVEQSATLCLGQPKLLIVNYPERGAALAAFIPPHQGTAR